MEIFVVVEGKVAEVWSGIEID